MINWKYVAPRLAVVIAVALFLWLGLNPLLHHWLVSGGQAVTGAKVDIGRVRTSVLATELRVDDLQVADPADPLKNLFAADELVLDVDSTALLRRQIVVEEGRLSGLRIGGARTTSGELEAGERLKLPIDLQLSGDQMAQFGRRWLQYAGEMLVEQLVAELETVRLTNELLHRWPAEYGRLEARGDALRRRVEALRRAVSEASRNPLRNIETIRTAADEVAAIEQQLHELRSEADRLHHQARRDHASLRAAQQRDVARVKRTLKLEQLDPQALSDYLLGEEQSRRLAELISWIEWGRRHLPQSDDDSGFEPERARGENILFAGLEQTPDFLIRSLVLDGTGTFAGRRLQYKGTASGLTNQPARYGKPMVLRLQTSGEAQLLVEAVFDRTGRLPHDRVTIHCPAIAQPQRLLGNQEQLALAVAPSNLQLTAFVELKGDYIAGQIIVKQQDLRLTPHVADKFGGPQLAAGLSSALDKIDTLEAQVNLSGSLQKLEWKVESNLGPRLAAAISNAFQQQIDTRLDALAADVERRAAGEVQRFEQTLLARQKEALEKLHIGDAEVATLSRLIAAQVGVPDRFRRGNLPLDDLFRRR